MPMCAQLPNWIWDAEQGFGLVETGLPLPAGTSWFPLSPFHSIEKYPHMSYFLVWGHGKQAQVTRLHWTCRAVRASSQSGTSTSGSDLARRSALYGGGQAPGGCSRYRGYGETHWILSEHCATRVRHRLTWCWHCWVFYIDRDPTRGVAFQEGHNLQVCSLDTRAKNRHAAWDDVGRYTPGNMQAMLLNPVRNAWSCHLQSEHCNTHSRRWVLCKGERLENPPEDFAQHLLVCLSLLISTLLKNIAVRDCHEQKRNHYNAVRWGHLADHQW